MQCELDRLRGRREDDQHRVAGRLDLPPVELGQHVPHQGIVLLHQLRGAEIAPFGLQPRRADQVAEEDRQHQRLVGPAKPLQFLPGVVARGPRNPRKSRVHGTGVEKNRACAEPWQSTFVGATTRHGPRPPHVAGGTSLGNAVRPTEADYITLDERKAAGLIHPCRESWD